MSRHPDHAARHGPIIGHDWGAALAWALAFFAPGSVDHLVVLPVGVHG